MRILTAISSLIFVLLAASAAQAQITTANVKVLVTGKGCSELKEVYLVINGNDLENRWVKLDPAGSCRWTADLGAGTISTSTARFSLRADIARSDCQRAAPNEEEMTANLTFACCVPGTPRNLSVKVEPTMQVSYVRDVRPFAGARVRGIKCTEFATFEEGQGAIGSTQFLGEDVYLQLGPLDRKRPPMGLLLDDIVVDDGVRVLTRDGVVYRLLVQRAQGKQKSTPNVSSNAILVDSKKLGALKLDRAEIEVIK